MRAGKVPGRSAGLVAGDRGGPGALPLRLGPRGIVETWLAGRKVSAHQTRAGKVPGRSAGLAAGDRADLVRFRYDSGRIEIVETWLAGRKVFAN